MELEKQVVSLELAKRLKELGMKQESYFSWWTVCQGDFVMESAFVPYHGEKIICSAFTVGELGDILPIRVKGTILVIGHLHRGWVLQYRLQDKVLWETYDNFEANARASMLIYLIEQGLLTL